MKRGLWLLMMFGLPILGQAGPFDPANDPGRDPWSYKTSLAFAKRLREAEIRIEDRRLLEALNAAEWEIDNRTDCKTYLPTLNQHEKTLDAMDASLKKDFPNSDDAAVEARKVEREQYRAVKKVYTECYNRQLQVYREWSNFNEYNVVDKASLESERKRLQSRAQALEAEIDEYIDAVWHERPLDHHKAGRRLAFTNAIDTIAKVMAVSRVVEVRHFGRGSWEQVKKDQVLRRGDELRTGPSGRAVIDMLDHEPIKDAGPSRFNIGRNSHVIFEQLAHMLELRREQYRRRGMIQLLRGQLRAFTKNMGFGSEFSVRTGTTICGIRGTEVIIDYDGNDVVRYFLIEGDASIRSPYVEQELQPKKPLTFKGGRIVEETGPPA